MAVRGNNAPAQWAELVELADLGLLLPVNVAVVAKYDMANVDAIAAFAEPELSRAEEAATADLEFQIQAAKDRFHEVRLEAFAIAGIFTSNQPKWGKSEFPAVDWTEFQARWPMVWHHFTAHDYEGAEAYGKTYSQLLVADRNLEEAKAKLAEFLANPTASAEAIKAVEVTRAIVDVLPAARTVVKARELELRAKKFEEPTE